VAPADRDDLGRDRRMKVEVLVRVDVVESKPGCLIGAELRFDLRPQLGPNRWSHAYIEPKPREVHAQTPGCVDEIGQPLRRQQRSPVDEYKMQPDAQTGKTARACDRVRGSSGGDHQTCRGEDPLFMRQLHAGIDLGREPKIVGRDDKALQSATSRSRKNLKNSIPSRSRRFIISGLRTISPTIEAIFGARK
jgi:hypothetical protein